MKNKKNTKSTEEELYITVESKVDGELYTIPIDMLEEFEKDEQEELQQLKKKD